MWICFLLNYTKLQLRTPPGHCWDSPPHGSWSEIVITIISWFPNAWLSVSCDSAPQGISPTVMNPEQTCLGPLDWVFHRFPLSSSVIIK
jgi:hypothetical protein